MCVFIPFVVTGQHVIFAVILLLDNCHRCLFAFMHNPTGYIRNNRKKNTKKRFVCNPFSEYNINKNKNKNKHHTIISSIEWMYARIHKSCKIRASVFPRIFFLVIQPTIYHFSVHWNLIIAAYLNRPKNTNTNTHVITVARISLKTHSAFFLLFIALHSTILRCSTLFLFVWWEWFKLTKQTKASVLFKCLY